MSTAEMQALLARAYTDSSFRKLLRHDPDDALGGYLLADAERRAIRELDRDRLEVFASSLLNKRRKRWLTAYPALFTMDGPALARYCARFHDLFPQRPGGSSADELLAFGTFLAETLHEPEDLPEYAGELARFERLLHRLRTVVPDPDPAPPSGLRRAPGVLIETFRCNVSDIHTALLAGDPPDVSREPETVVGFDGRIIRVGAATLLLLDLCDGSRDLAAVVAAVERHYAADGLTEQVTDTLRQLAGMGMVDGLLDP